MLDDKMRTDFLCKLGANKKDSNELLMYNKNYFDLPKDKLEFTKPLEDELFIEAWNIYKKESEQAGVFSTLKKYLVQLNFPLKSGISKTEHYKDVTLRGVDVSSVREATGLSLIEPEILQLDLFQTFGGKIPILFTKNRDDFKTLVSALSMKNETENLPDSMGACMVKGLNNWDRIKRSGMPLSEIIPHKELYQDKLIILSSGPYSGISAADIKLDEAEWERLSIVIRREHECAHYFTQRYYGSARNNLLDELIADYVGITEAAGCFSEFWCLNFMGLNNFPAYIKGRRLENYINDPPISESSFIIMQKIVYYAINGLKKLDVIWTDLSKEEKIQNLCYMSIEELASFASLD